MMNKVVPGRRSREPKTYTITLRFSDLVWMGVGAALALSIFFLFGLLIGRGYVPAAPEELAPDAAMHATVEGAEANASVQEQKAPEPVVLKPEELTYPEKLGQTEPQAKPAKETAAEQETPKAPAAQQAPEKSAAKAPAKAEEQADDGPEEGAAFDMAQPEPGESPFHYVYQCAAFKDAAQAKALAKRLADKGMKTQVAEGSVKGQVWHRVQVLFTGTPSQTVPLRDGIEAVTGQKPIRVSKKPAS
jgi:cell division protein FtsN